MTDLIDKGIESINNGDHEKALELFKKALEKDESDAIANHWVGATLGQLGDSEEALVHLERAIENSDDVYLKAQTHVCIALVMNDLGRREEAVKYAIRAYALDRDDPYKEQLIGMLADPDVMGSFGPPEKTAPTRLKALKEERPAPTEPEYMTLIEEASRALGENDTDRFEGLIKRAFELAPDKPICSVGLSTLKEMKGDLHGAAKALVEAGRLYMREGDTDRAFESFVNATRFHKRNPEAWFNIGMIHKDDGAMDRAVKALKKSRTGRSKDPRTHLELGICYYDLLEFEDAEKSVRRSIELDSTTEAWLILGAVQIAMGEDSVVLESLEEADRLSMRGESRVSFALGLVRLLRGERENARERLREWVEASEESHRRTNRGVGHLLRKDMTREKAWLTLDDMCDDRGTQWERDLVLKVATRLVPDSAQVWFRLSKVAADIQVRKSAQDTAYQLTPDDPDIKFAEALAIYRFPIGGGFENEKRALDLFREVLDIDPDHRSAQKWVAYIEEEFKELERQGHSPHLGFYGANVDTYDDWGECGY